MNLKKIAQWLAIAAMIGALISFIAFKEAAIKIDGKTISIEEFITQQIENEIN